MNEQLNQALAQALTKATESTVAAIGFLSAELPDVVAQLLMWKLAVSALDFTVCAALIYGIFRAVKRVYAQEYDCKSDAESAKFISALLGCALAVGPFIGAWSCADTMLQIAVAPKIYLIEYAADLAKGLAK